MIYGLSITPTTTAMTRKVRFWVQYSKLNDRVEQQQTQFNQIALMIYFCLVIQVFSNLGVWLLEQLFLLFSSG